MLTTTPDVSGMPCIFRALVPLNFPPQQRIRSAELCLSARPPRPAQIGEPLHGRAVQPTTARILDQRATDKRRGLFYAGGIPAHRRGGALAHRIATFIATASHDKSSDNYFNKNRQIKIECKVAMASSSTILATKSNGPARSALPNHSGPSTVSETLR